MAEFVLTDPFISIGGNDVSDHFTSIGLPVEAETQEATAFGDCPGETRRLRAEWDWSGLKDWSAWTSTRTLTTGSSTTSCGPCSA